MSVAVETTVRPARPADREAAVALWTALHREHERLDARYRLADDAALRWATDFRDWTQSRQDRVWLAETLLGEAVGLLTAHLYEPAPTFQPYRLVYVDDLYVAPDARRVGVGQRLLEEARAWGREHGAVELRAGILAANAAGRAFWTRETATDFSVTVTQPL